jgi:hypothetical protein
MISRDKNKTLMKSDLEKLIGERDLGKIQNFVKLKNQAAPSSKKDIDAYFKTLDEYYGVSRGCSMGVTVS